MTSKVVQINTAEWQSFQKKAALCHDYYYKDDGGYAAPPHTVCISVNNSCFMRCSMCDVGQANRNKGDNSPERFFHSRVTGGEGSRELPMPAIKQLVDELAPHNTVVRANFLEPLLRQDITDLADYTVGKGLDFYIITNGYLLPKKASDLVRCGTRSIRVSLDGPRQVHDQIRGVPSSFDRAVEGIQIALAERRRRGVDYPLIGACYTISNTNYDRILDFYRELDQLGIADKIYVAFNFLKYNTEQEAAEQTEVLHNGFRLTESSMEATDVEGINADVVWEQICSLHKEFPQDKYKYHFNPRLDHNELKQWFDSKTYLHPGTPCLAPWSIAQVFYNGDVGINGRCVSPTFGNILEQPFRDIWNSETALNFRRGLKKNPDMPACNRCARIFRKHD